MRCMHTSTRTHTHTHKHTHTHTTHTHTHTHTHTPGMPPKQQKISGQSSISKFFSPKPSPADASQKRPRSTESEDVQLIEEDLKPHKRQQPHQQQPPQQQQQQQQQQQRKEGVPVPNVTSDPQRALKVNNFLHVHFSLAYLGLLHQLSFPLNAGTQKARSPACSSSDQAFSTSVQSTVHTSGGTGVEKHERVLCCTLLET